MKNGGGGKMKKKDRILVENYQLSEGDKTILELAQLNDEIQKLRQKLDLGETDLHAANAEIRIQITEQLRYSAELLSKNKERIAVAEMELATTIELKKSRKELELQRDKVAFRTILEAKNLESKMKDVQFYQVLENIGFAILIHQDGVILYANNTALDYFKASQPGDLLNTPLALRFYGDYYRKIQQQINHLEGPRPVSMPLEVKCVRLDAALFDVEVVSSYTFHNGKPAIISRLLDIADRVLRSKAILEKNEEVNKLIIARDKFFAIIAHDLRGPLGGFMALTEILADSTYELPDGEKKQMIAEMSLAARNTFNLLESLLEWAKMDLNLVDFNPVPINLHSLCFKTKSIMEESAKAKFIEFQLDIPEEIQVYADQDMLQSIFRNLYSNAIKFTPDQGKVFVYCKPLKQRKIEIFVEDTGIGMPEHFRENLFILTSKNKRLGTKGEKSTGLGLHLCKQFIEKNGGEFKVNSIENKGSTFSFTLPLANKKQQAIVSNCL